MRHRNAFIAVGVVILIAGGTTLWSQDAFDSEPEFPKSMCNGYVEGTRVKNLMSSREGGLTEDSKGFPPANQLYTKSHCEIHLGSDTVTIGTKYPSEETEKRQVFARSDRKVTFGSAYGELDDSGSIEIYIPCPHKEDPEALLSIGASADSADREYAPADSVDETTHELADLTADLARTFSQKRFKCEGAKDLPKGSLRISPALDLKP